MDGTDKVTDRAHLTSRTYATDAALSVRIDTHRLYTQPKVDFADWVLNHVPWRGNEQVLDIGCGAGAYIEPIQRRLDRGGNLLAGDLSLGMLQDTAARTECGWAGLFCADAMYLPLPAHCCDVALANHMFYHVPDIERAVAEIWRILRPKGYLLAATNARNSMQRFVDEIELACAALGSRVTLPESSARTRFNLENGAEPLRTRFASVQVYQSASSLVFPQAEPAVAYINSMRDLYEHLLPVTVTWGEVMDQIGRQVGRVVVEMGWYRVDKTSGFFLARRD